jgi:hypothetical protein
MSFQKKSNSAKKTRGDALDMLREASLIHSFEAAKGR